MQTVGPVAPGDEETVTLTGGGLAARENQTFTVEVRSGGEVIAAEVITVDCDPHRHRLSSSSPSSTAWVAQRSELSKSRTTARTR